MSGVLKRYDATAGVWVPVVGSPQAQPGLLAKKAYTAGSFTQIPVTTTALTAADTTNLRVTFVAPASGEVIVRLSAYVYVGASTSYTWGILQGVATVITQNMVLSGTNAIDARKETSFQISGLTPGTTYTWDFAHARPSGTGVVEVRSGSGQQILMEVWDAQTGAGVMVPAQPPLLHVQDQKAAGTSGGGFTSGAWQTRVLNTTLTNEISGASVAANQISLPVGTYEIEAFMPAYFCGMHKGRLQNTTAGTTLLVGSTMYSATTGDDPSVLALVRGRFSLTATSLLELQHRCATTNASNGFGVEANMGVVEVYTDVMIRKVG